MLENIGPRENHKRLVIGLALFAASFGIGLILIALGVNRWWRVGLALPLWMAALGLFQSKEKT